MDQCHPSGGCGSHVQEDVAVNLHVAVDAVVDVAVVDAVVDGGVDVVVVVVDQDKNLFVVDY